MYLGGFIDTEVNFIFDDVSIFVSHFVTTHPISNQAKALYAEKHESKHQEHACDSYEA